MTHAKSKIAAAEIEPIKQSEHTFKAVGVALIDARCGKCQRLLFRGTLRGEIKCPRCGHLNRWA